MEEQEEYQETTTEEEQTEHEAEPSGDHQEETEDSEVVADEDEFVDLFESEITSETIVYTPSGNIHISHSITLGEAMISILLVCILLFMVLDRFIRR